MRFLTFPEFVLTTEIINRYEFRLPFNPSHGPEVKVKPVNSYRLSNEREKLYNYWYHHRRRR